MTFVFVFLCTIVEFASASPRVATYTGIYEGRIDNYGTGTYESYEGIKFANQERFKEAILVEDSNTTYAANAYGSPCYQFSRNKLFGEEDCLFLNVYTCDVNKTVPVIIFIHGGSFATGTGRLGTQWFMQSCKVVYVTIQYRLGPFGLLDFNSKIFPSNIALRDQLLAIKWVNRNIKFFGGDPDKVTLQGQSAGAASVNLHMQSPLSKGYFRAAISQSGTGCVSWAVSSRQRARMALKYFASQTMCYFTALFLKDSEPGDKVAECLMKLSPVTLITVANLMGANLRYVSLPFEPVIEGEGSNSMITHYPWMKSVEGQVPWISGINSNEGLTLTQLGVGFEESVILSLLANLYLPDVFDYRETAINPDAITAQIRKYYDGNGVLTPKKFESFIRKVVTDSFFTYPNYECQKLHKGTPTYNYLFGQRLPNTHHTGVGHAEEMMFFYTYFQGTESDVRKSEMTKKVSETMVNLWTSFAEQMVPSAPGVEWKPWSPNEDMVFVIGENGHIGMKPDPKVDAIHFWENLPFRNKYDLNLNETLMKHFWKKLLRSETVIVLD